MVLNSIEATGYRNWWNERKPIKDSMEAALEDVEIMFELLSAEF